MLDINLIRKDPEFVKAALAKREYEVDFTELLQWDARRKEIIAEGEALKAERNRINKEIPRLKKEGADVSAVMAQMKESGEKVKSLDEELRQVEAKIEEFVAALPNLPADDVVAGGKENNQVVKVFGEKPVFNFEAKNHVDLCTSLGLIDYERGVKLAGNGYWLYTDLGAQLEWALLNYFITTHIKDGYTFMLPPHILTYECGYTAGQFPKFKEDVYRVSTGDDSFHFLLPTAETALINLYRGEILEEKDLPGVFTSFAPLVLPIILILINTVLSALKLKTGFYGVLIFLGQPIIAVGLGLLLAIVTQLRNVDRETALREMEKGMEQAGIILLVTGGGGALGQIIKDSGLGTYIAQGMAHANIPLILLPFLISTGVRFIQGSGTVAMITAAGITAPILAAAGTVNPIVGAFACCGGSLFFSYFNDSYFWVVNNLMGFKDTKEQIRNWSVTSTVAWGVGFVELMILSIFMP